MRREIVSSIKAGLGAAAGVGILMICADTMYRLCRAGHGILAGAVLLFVIGTGMGALHYFLYHHD